MGSHQTVQAPDSGQKADTRIARKPQNTPSGRSPAAQIQRLQARAGNRATVGLLDGSIQRRNSTTVQRRNSTTTAPQPTVPAPQPQDDELIAEGLDRGVGVVDTLGGQGGNWAQMGGLAGNQYLSGNTNTSTAQAGEGFGVIGMGTGAFSVYSASKQVHQARKGLAEEQEAGRGSEATARAAKRDLKSGSANVGQGVLNTGSQALGFTSALSQHVANSTGATTGFAGANNLLGGIGGAIALPVTLASSIRMGRKTLKQYARFRKLRKNVEDPETSADEAKKALAKQKEALDALEQTLAEANLELFKSRQKLAAARSAAKKNLVELTDKVAVRQAAVDQLEAKIRDAKTEIQSTEQAKITTEAALLEYQQRAAKGEQSPADIRAYAMHKNSAGWKKKLVSTVAGFIGVGGGMAATLAAFAGAGLAAGVSMAAATPVGWALCGAAAVAGLALAGYAFWKWASKRYDRLVNEGGAERGFKTFLKSINPFAKGIPDSQRQKMAVRLYELAGGSAPDATPQDVLEAQKLIADLGLDWNSLKMKDHRDASLKLIHAKMAS